MGAILPTPTHKVKYKEAEVLQNDEVKVNNKTVLDEIAKHRLKLYFKEGRLTPKL
jgi:hypothetical protein